MLQWGVVSALTYNLQNIMRNVRLFALTVVSCNMQLLL